jgi:hypothetical protein
MFGGRMVFNAEGVDSNINFLIGIRDLGNCMIQEKNPVREIIQLIDFID